MAAVPKTHPKDDCMLGLRGWLRRWRCFYAVAFGVALAAGQSETRATYNPQEAGQGSLMYRSPLSGAYELVPLTHTEAVLDVQGLVAAATVTQQYVNSSSAPIEATYVFPLPHDAAVYDLEIRIGNRVIRSEIHERAEAKRVYEAAKNEGKRAALLEQERPNIFTASVANIMPSDRIEVRLRFVEPLKWEAGKMPVSHGRRTEIHTGKAGWGSSGYWLGERYGRSEGCFAHYADGQESAKPTWARYFGNRES